MCVYLCLCVYCMRMRVTFTDVVGFRNSKHKQESQIKNSKHKQESQISFPTHASAKTSLKSIHPLYLYIYVYICI